MPSNNIPPHQNVDNYCRKSDRQIHEKTRFSERPQAVVSVGGFGLKKRCPIGNLQVRNYDELSIAQAGLSNCSNVRRASRAFYPWSLVVGSHSIWGVLGECWHGYGNPAILLAVAIVRGGHDGPYQPANPELAIMKAIYCDSYICSPAHLSDRNSSLLGRLVLNGFEMWGVHAGHVTTKNLPPKYGGEEQNGYISSRQVQLLPGKLYL